jgi:hypothetical protein
LGASIRHKLPIFGVLAGILFLGYFATGSGMCGMFLSQIYIMTLWLITVVRTGTMAAVSIAREKEARTWPILLGTCLDDWEIIRGKAAAVLCQNWPAWAVLAIHSGFFLFLRPFNQFRGFDATWPLVYMVSRLLNVTGYLIFLIGAGLYFGLRLKSSTVAVMATLGSLIGLYILRQVISLMVVALIRPAFFGARSVWLWYSLVSIACYASVGVLLLRRTKSQLRQHTF